MKIQITEKGANDFRKVAKEWQGIFSNEMCFMQHLYLNKDKALSKEEIENTLTGFQRPTISECINIFEKRGDIVFV